MTHIIDLHNEHRYIFCDDELLQLKGIAMVQNPDNSLQPFISYPIVGDDWQTIGEGYYESIHPLCEGFRECIFGHIGQKIDIKSWPLLNALRYSVRQGHPFDVGKILKAARNYGLQVCDGYAGKSPLILMVHSTDIKGTYRITSCNNGEVMSYPIPDILVSLTPNVSDTDAKQASGLSTNSISCQCQTAFNPDLDEYVFSFEDLKLMLAKAICDYSEFFYLSKQLELDLILTVNIDRKTRFALRKLESTLNNPTLSFWDEV